MDCSDLYLLSCYVSSSLEGHSHTLISMALVICMDGFKGLSVFNELLGFWSVQKSKRQYKFY